jgi:NAD(P)-dependent dehydrogenase (short-subunit alcohol dehydrogenase family)
MTPEENTAPLKGRTVVITGASDGVGAAAVPGLIARGAQVVVVGRSPAKTAAVAQANGVPHHVVDFAELDQVRSLAAKLLVEYPRIDVLVNNAGFVAARRELTVDGHESTFQVNHLAPFLLTNLLREPLVAAAARVITTSSFANLAGRVNLHDLDGEQHFSTFRAYGTSKLLNIVFTRELQRRWGPQGVNAASFHPGAVRSSFGSGSTPMVRALYRTPLNRLLISPEKGADTLLWLASTTPGTDWTPGGHFAKRRPAPVNPQGRDDALAEAVWNISLELTAE